MSFFKKLKSAFSNLKGSKDNFELEDTLLEADFGVDLSEKISKEIGRETDIAKALRSKIESILKPLIMELKIDSSKKPFVIILEGVNGSGKTTTVAKLAYHFKQHGFSVDIAACDTFRVAATDQLSVWAEKLRCNIFKSDKPKDPASVAFEALNNSQSDVLIVDTAGRLQNNVNLMNELSKIHRVLKKIDETAPHVTILVLDATTGQNLMDQVKEFQKIQPISGIIINKLDGNAKGGALVRVSNEFKLPIFGVGLGESERDFEPFSIDKFLRDLVE